MMKDHLKSSSSLNFDLDNTSCKRNDETSTMTEENGQSNTIIDKIQL